MCRVAPGFQAADSDRNFHRSSTVKNLSYHFQWENGKIQSTIKAEKIIPNNRKWKSNQVEFSVFTFAHRSGWPLFSTFMGARDANQLPCNTIGTICNALHTIGICQNYEKFN
jgi:hypothetical protein